ncbi:Flagellar biosynthesis protein flhA (fragment) [Mesotoga infera]
MPNQLGLGDIQKVLKNLLKKGVSIRNMVTILETLADYSNATRDTDMLTEYVRQALSRVITKQFIMGQPTKVITLDQGLEQRIIDSIQQTERGNFISIDPDIVQRILNNLSYQVQKLTSLGEQPIVITAPIVRLYFKRLTEQLTSDLIVLSYNEVEPTVEIESIGMVNI